MPDGAGWLDAGPTWFKMTLRSQMVQDSSKIFLRLDRNGGSDRNFDRNREPKEDRT